MRLMEAIYTHLTTHPGLSALVGTRVHPDTLPKSPQLPAIAYTQISGPRTYSHDGASGVADARIQFDIVAQSRDQCDAVAAQLESALSGYQGTLGGAGGVEVDSCFLDAEATDYEDDVEPRENTSSPEGTFSQSLDFYFQFELPVV